LPLPVFTSYKFVQSIHHNGQLVDQWSDAVERIDYFDYESTQIPLEFNSNVTISTFDHFEIGSQNPRYFEIPKECNGTLTVQAMDVPTGTCSWRAKMACIGVVGRCSVQCCSGACSAEEKCSSCMGKLHSTCVACLT